MGREEERVGRERKEGGYFFFKEIVIRKENLFTKRQTDGNQML